MIVRNKLDIEDVASVTHSIDYVKLWRPYDAFHILPNIECWLKEKVFESRFSARPSLKMFVTYSCVDISRTPTSDRDDLVVQVPSRWCNYERSCLLFAVTLTVIDYYLSSMIRKSRRSL